MEANPDKEEMEDMSLNDERDCYWRLFFKDNEVRIDDKKELIHYKIWDV